jgi:ribosomal protein S13
MSNSMLTKEEEEQQQQQHEDAIIAFTEEVLQARGIECDSRISKISEEQLKEILEEVRQLCKKNKNSKDREQLEIARQ